MMLYYDLYFNDDYMVIIKNNFNNNVKQNEMINKKYFRINI